MDNSAIRNLRDFLLQYNKISESCFLHCVNHLSDRDLSQDEGGCVDMCTKKHVSVNHKVMQVYMEIQPEIINRRIQDVNKQQQQQQEQLQQQQQQQGAIENGEKIKAESNLSLMSDSSNEAKTLTQNGIKLNGDKTINEIARTNT